jgi:hypothetical protein
MAAPYDVSHAALVASTKKAAKDVLGLVGLYDDPSHDDSGANLGNKETTNRNYPLKLTSDGSIAYVNVPWTDTDTNTDTDTTYTAGTGISIDNSSNNSISLQAATTSGLGGVKLAQAADSSALTLALTTSTNTTGANFPLRLGNNNVAYTNVPLATTSAFGVVKLGAARLASLTTTPSATNSGQYYPVQTDANDRLVVDVPSASAVIYNSSRPFNKTNINSDANAKNVYNFAYLGQFQGGMYNKSGCADGWITSHYIADSGGTRCDGYIAQISTCANGTQQATVGSIGIATDIQVKCPAQTIAPGAATSSAMGVVKLGSDTVQTVTAATGAPFSESGRTYPIQNNSTGQLVVNVPWTDSASSPELSFMHSFDPSDPGAFSGLMLNVGGSTMNFVPIADSFNGLWNRNYTAHHVVDPYDIYNNIDLNIPGINFGLGLVKLFHRRDNTYLDWYCREGDHENCLFDSNGALTEDYPQERYSKRNYPLKLDKAGVAYVTVPWEGSGGTYNYNELSNRLLLNGASSNTGDQTFYAPISGGTAGQVLTSNGATSAPSWQNSSDMSVITPTYDTTSGLYTVATAPAGFVLTAGARITLKLPKASEYSTTKLKVGATDTKPVVVNGSASDVARGMLKENAVYTFVYDGTNYNAIGVSSSGLAQSKINAGTEKVEKWVSAVNLDLARGKFVTTAAGTLTEYDVSSNYAEWFENQTGARIFLKMHASNTGTSSKLAVNGMASGPIAVNGSTTLTPGVLKQDHVYIFVYNNTGSGGYWDVVGDINTDTNTTYQAGSGISITGTNNTISLSAASTGVLGGVKLGAAKLTTLTTTPSASATGSYYPVQTDNNDKLVVMVPDAAVAADPPVSTNCDEDVYLTGGEQNFWNSDQYSSVECMQYGNMVTVSIDVEIIENLGSNHASSYDYMVAFYNDGINSNLAFINYKKYCFTRILRGNSIHYYNKYYNNEADDPDDVFNANCSGNGQVGNDPYGFIASDGIFYVRANCLETGNRVIMDCTFAVADY